MEIIFACWDDLPKRWRNSRKGLSSIHSLSSSTLAWVGRCIFRGSTSRQWSRCERRLEIDANFVLARAVLGESYLQLGRFPEALAELQAASDLSGASPLYHAMLGHAFAVSGKSSEAHKIMDLLEARAAQSYVSSYCGAVIHVGLGDKQRAIQWLEKAYEDRARELVMLNIEPLVDTLRSDVRFQNLLRRMNF